MFSPAGHAALHGGKRSTYTGRSIRTGPTRERPCTRSGSGVRSRRESTLTTCPGAGRRSDRWNRRGAIDMPLQSTHNTIWLRLCPKLILVRTLGPEMRKDVREFIRRLEAVGLTVESTPGHYRVLRDGKPLRKQNGMPFTLPFSPDTVRWRRSAIVELRKLGIHL